MFFDGHWMPAVHGMGWRLVPLLLLAVVVGLLVGAQRRYGGTHETPRQVLQRRLATGGDRAMQCGVIGSARHALRGAAVASAAVLLALATGCADNAHLDAVGSAGAEAAPIETAGAAAAVPGAIAPPRGAPHDDGDARLQVLHQRLDDGSVDLHELWQLVHTDASHDVRVAALQAFAARADAADVRTLLADSAATAPPAVAAHAKALSVLHAPAR